MDFQHFKENFWMIGFNEALYFNFFGGFSLGP